MNRLSQIVVSTFALALLICTPLDAQYTERISPDLEVKNQILPDATPARNFGVIRTARRQEQDVELGPSEDIQNQESPSDKDSLRDEVDSDLEKMKLDFEEDEQADDRRPARPAFGPWPRKGIRAISLDVTDNDANQPEDKSAQLLNSGGTGWTQFAPQQKVFAWVAPNIRYQPLYFEDVALERYGQTACPYRQSVLSGFHFFKSLQRLPLEMTRNHPQSCDYPLGFCRPGNKVDYTIQKNIFGFGR